MGRKKRKEYFDRNEVLQSKAKKPNISPRLEVEAITTGKMGNFERLFNKKLFVNDPFYLDAMVLLNDICVLFPKGPLKASSIEFPVDLEVMSGRKKKGARKIKADTIVCLMTMQDGTIAEFRTPVGGQLLEYNESLSEHLDILHEEKSGERYIAILFPDTEIPSANQSVEEWKAVQAAMSDKSNECFSFIRTGNCKHGDKCKFSHELPEDKKETATASTMEEGSEISSNSELVDDSVEQLETVELSGESVS